MSKPPPTVSLNLPMPPGKAPPRLRVQGIGRMSDNPRALLVMVSSIPTDDDLRELHDYLRQWQPADYLG